MSIWARVRPRVYRGSSRKAEGWSPFQRRVRPARARARIR